jgi:hypothetical protein
MIEHEINKLDNFMMGWYSDPEEISICDDLIEFWRVSEQYEGVIHHTSAQKLIMKDIKDSIEVDFPHGHPLHIQYVCEYLQRRAEAYIEKYPACNKGDPWQVLDGVNLQYYPPGGGFHAWHTERMSCNDPMSSRHLVFMTYLNDVTDGGETEFLHQGIKIKPEKGLTIIWPTDWTFTHRGVVSTTQEKWIVTGWYNYYEHGEI